MGNIKSENNEQRIVNSGQLSIINEKLKVSLFTVIFIRNCKEFGKFTSPQPISLKRGALSQIKAFPFKGKGWDGVLCKIVYTSVFIFALGSFSTLADIKKDSLKLEHFAQDSSKITVRKPLESKMTALRKLKDYQYTVQESQVIDTWWKRLLRRLFNWFNSFFTGVGNPTFWKTAAYVFIASVIVYITLKLMGVDFSGLYRKKTNNEIPYETLGENIHAIDFADSIAEAITQKNYRLAVRLYYLKTLKELTDREMIDWRINKTNRSYVYELNSPTLRPDFERITLQFEYAWYGDFPVDETQFLNIKNQFLTFSEGLSRES